jgi:hypothetical protein
VTDEDPQIAQIRLRAAYDQQIENRKTIVRAILLWGPIYVVMVAMTGKETCRQMATVTAGLTWLAAFAQHPPTGSFWMQRALVALSIASGFAAGLAMLMGY